MVDLVISVVYISVIRQAKMNIIREEEKIEELAHSVDKFSKEMGINIFATTYFFLVGAIKSNI